MFTTAMAVMALVELEVAKAELQKLVAVRLKLQIFVQFLSITNLKQYNLLYASCADE